MLNLRLGNSSRKSADDPVIASRVRACRREHQRQPDIHVRVRSKSLGHDADDSVALTTDPKITTQGGRIATEHLGPQPIAQDNSMLSPGLVVIGIEWIANFRWDTKSLKEVLRN